MCHSVMLTDWVDMGFVKGLLCRKMVLFCGFLWDTVSTFLVTLLGFFVGVILRFDSVAEEEEYKVAFPNYLADKEDEFYSNSEKGNELDSRDYQEQVAESEVELPKFVEETHDADIEEEEPETTKFFFKFQFQSSGIFQSEPASATLSRGEFTEGKSSSHHLEEEGRSNNAVMELYVEPRHCQLGKEHVSDSDFLADDDFALAENDNEAETANDFMEGLEENPESISLREGPNCHQEESIDFDEDELAEENFLHEHDFIGTGFASESNTANFETPGTMEFIDSPAAERFLSDKDFERTVRLNAVDDSCDENNVIMSDEMYEPEDFGEEERDEMTEVRESEEAQIQHLNGDHDHEIYHSAEDSNALEHLWKHQDLIQQLKMELKKVKATGLPTILEESEYPKLMQDLKPWKMDEKTQHNCRMKELPKFYKSYRERMRKFDIFNYQKRYALGYFQSKDPLQSHSTGKPSTSAFASLLPHSFLPCRPKKSEADSMKKLIGELRSDLEMVYVGQLCLSWEFLQWQYVKALELWGNDPYLSRRYNQVAGEFQQFQVLLQRFIENEPFQGPRTESYSKNRYLMRYLLQVPVIREDSTKDRNKKRRKGRDKDAITSDILIEILEESIRIMWRFIRADKDAHNLFFKSPSEAFNQQLQTPLDLEFLKEIRLDLQKKEKRLKELLRSGHCILKKFQKHQEDEMDHFLYFFSQVEMKLICRVLNMSRVTTEQLFWCGTKLSGIHFSKKRIHVEPSFLLFPY